MATWTTPIPPNDVVAGDPGHPGMHNALSNNVTEIRTNVDLNLPANDPRLVAGAAGTATVRAIGTTATTVVAGNDARLTAGAAGVATVRALGTTATTAAPGTAGLAGAAVAQANSTATDVAGLVTDFNALLAKLRTRGVIAP